MIAFIDTNIPMYAAGKEHPCKTGCLEIMKAIACGEIQAYTNTEVFQEILYRYYSINERKLGVQLFDSFYTIMQGYILSVQPPDILLARELTVEYPTLSSRDLIHLAVMLNNGITHVFTTDQGFQNINGLQVISPT
ncbi:MAG: type II toxin-antitoxin system VapC family toxin [Firmicutes bacterium]|nr:type II toxin-antitoxin system VapC family toxin [Bacillota bacterium]